MVTNISSDMPTQAINPVKINNTDAVDKNGDNENKEKPKKIRWFYTYYPLVYCWPF